MPYTLTMTQEASAIVVLSWRRQLLGQSLQQTITIVTLHHRPTLFPTMIVDTSHYTASGVCPAPCFSTCHVNCIISSACNPVLTMPWVTRHRNTKAASMVKLHLVR